MADEKPPVLPPKEAIAYFRRKGILFGFSWEDVWQEEHAKAFTVAKAMTRDLIEDIREAVDQAIAQGETLAMFRKQLTPVLIARGWWGRKTVIDPANGEEVVAQLGSPRRLKTIYQTNMRTSYQAGRYERIQRQKSSFPFMRYMSVMDGRERPEHGAWHGTILPVDDPWWDTHYPPCGWNCRCTPQPLSQRMIDRRGWKITDEPHRFPMKRHINRRTGEITEVERGVDPGWSYHVGKANLDGLVPPPIDAAGDDEGAIAAVSAGDKTRLSGFFDAFGLKDSSAIEKGMVFRDQAGWPIAISAGLFRTGRGQVSNAARRDPESLRHVAAAITDPVEIRWRWVQDVEGRPMLMRRYIGARAIADFGRTGWRWQITRSPRFRRGHLVWTRK
ncbi:phage minor head protein [Sphingorhabdus sp. 109]|uniref:phage minor head protein n=1 Tax=Sphingorhabdus sp. 109 TaxID=2653173 RepID=UPI0012F2679D|nr:phage minor head protein [Sphingorhabdus sp. 109]VWX62574.1 conserved hypothetical protein [Sphingorhabdus sp. 109]